MLDDSQQCAVSPVELRAALVAEAALLHAARDAPLQPWRSSLQQPACREEALRFLDSAHDVSLEELTSHSVSTLCLAGPPGAAEKRVACVALLELISAACPAALEPHLTRLCNWFHVELPGDNLGEEGRWCAARICRALASAFNYQGVEHQAFIELDAACCLKASLLAMVDRPPTFGALLDRQRIWFTRAVAECLCSVSSRMPGGLAKLRARAESLLSTFLQASRDLQSLVDNPPKQAAVAHQAWVLGALLEGFRGQIDSSVFECALVQALSALCSKGPALLQQALLPCVACVLRCQNQLPVSPSSLIQALHHCLLSESKAVCARATEAIWLISRNLSEARAAGALGLQVEDLQALVKVQPALLRVLCASRSRALASDAALAISALSSLSHALTEAGVEPGEPAQVAIIAACLAGCPADPHLACEALRSMASQAAASAAHIPADEVSAEQRSGAHLAAGVQEAARILLGRGRGHGRNGSFPKDSERFEAIRAGIPDEVLRVGVQEALSALIELRRPISAHAKPFEYEILVLQLLWSLMTQSTDPLPGLKEVVAQFRRSHMAFPAAARRRGPRVVRIYMAMAMLEHARSQDAKLSKLRVVLCKLAACHKRRLTKDLEAELSKVLWQHLGLRCRHCRLWGRPARRARDASQEQASEQPEAESPVLEPSVAELLAAELVMAQQPMVEPPVAEPLADERSRAEALVAEAPAQPPLAAGEVAEWMAFTPRQIAEEFCKARTWSAGMGGQCSNKFVAGDCYCRQHSREKWKVHGRVDGPIPEGKLRQFKRAAAARAQAEAAAAAAAAAEAQAEAPATPPRKRQRRGDEEQANANRDVRRSSRGGA